MATATHSTATPKGAAGTASPRRARTSAAKSQAAATAAKSATKAVEPSHAVTLRQVANRSRKKVNTVVHLTRDASLKLIDTQRAIWLAGLGALAKVTTTTGTKGEQAFEALIKAGEKLESQARGAIDNNADRLKMRINDASKVVDERIDIVGDAFDTRVKQALARLGYPKRKARAA